MGEHYLSHAFMELKRLYLEQLSRMHYSAGSIKNCLRTFSQLEKFMAKHGSTDYSIVTGRAFLDEMAWIGNPNGKITKVTVRRLNELMETGSFDFRKKCNDLKCPAYFQKLLDDYVEHMDRKGLRASSITKYSRNIMRALQEFQVRGVIDISALQPLDIYAAFEKSNNKQGFVSSTRSFLKYLFKKGLHGKDMSLIVPSVRRPKPVPSIYTKAEVEKMLSVINRFTVLGKRDYVAILIALRLGMRGGDILKLKTCDFDFNAKTIEFTQKKTLVQQRLELLPEIEEALTSYLADRINPQNSPYVFLTTMAPYGPMLGCGVGRAVAKYISNASIDAGNRKHGSHALRMTLASELASENVPYDVIRKILGHEDAEVIKHYVKLDIEMLRKCALEVPRPIGLLAEKLSIETGGEAL